MHRSRWVVRFGGAALMATGLLSMLAPLAARAASTADVAVVIVDHPDPVVTKWNLTYTISVTNVGQPQATAQDVRVHDHLSSQQSYFSSDTTQGTCKFNAGDFDCELGNLAPGATVTIRLVVKELATFQDSTSVNVSTHSSDPVPGNNDARAITIVKKGPPPSSASHSPKPHKSPKPSSSRSVPPTPTSSVTGPPVSAGGSSTTLPMLGAILSAMGFIALAGVFAWREHRGSDQ